MQSLLYRFRSFRRNSTLVRRRTTPDPSPSHQPNETQLFCTAWSILPALKWGRHRPSGQERTARVEIFHQPSLRCHHSKGATNCHTLPRTNVSASKAQRGRIALHNVHMKVIVDEVFQRRQGYSTAPQTATMAQARS